MYNIRLTFLEVFRQQAGHMTCLADMLVSCALTAGEDHQPMKIYTRFYTDSNGIGAHAMRFLFPLDLKKREEY